MRRPLLLLVLLLLLGGCEAPGPGGPVPLPLTVFTSTTVQAELPTDAPLRLSLSFRGSAGIDTATVVFDAPFSPPLTEIEVGGGEVPRLSGRSGEVLAYVGDVPEGSRLRVRTTDLVLYADRDGDGALTSRDRPLSLTTAVGFAPDITAQLGELSLVAATYYYESTADRVTSYVRIAVLGGPVGVISHRRPIEVGLTPEVFVRNELGCSPRSADPFDATPTRSVRVANDLDADAVCGLEEADCQPLDLTSAPTDIGPRLPSVESARVRACRRNTTLELLVIEDRAARCRDCACGWATDVRTFVVRTSSTPAWWPCGREDTPYCDVPGSLLAIPGECRE